MSGVPRKQKPKRRAPVGRFVARVPRNLDGDDPLFDDRELEYWDCGDEKVKPPDN